MSHSIKEGSWIDVEPLSLDFLYQQYAIKRDERLGRTRFNTFGLYVLSYLDGLRTMGVRQGYLGTGGWEHVIKEKYRGLLLGCSSITTADNFFRFMNAVNPEASAIVTDINPLAVKLAKEALRDRKQNQVVQSDAQHIPLENESIDFVATNFLVPNLIDVEGSGKETIVKVLKETSRVLSQKGRLVMVEQLGRNDLRWLVHYASQQGLVLATGGPEGGTNRPALILNKATDFRRIAYKIPGFIDESAKAVAYVTTFSFNLDPRSYFGGKKDNSVRTLIFKKRK